MHKLKSIAVFCASSSGNDQQIIDDAILLGTSMAKQDIALVYGGAKVGIMGSIADAVIENKGKTLGVIPEFLKHKEIVHLGLDKLITTETMHERKAVIQEHSDAFIALPGGFGTFEELFEIVTWAQLGLHQKPIGLLNSSGFYTHLIEMFQTMVAKGLLKKENLDLVVIADNVDDLLIKLRSYQSKAIPKWLNK